MPAAKINEAELLAAIEALRGASPEQQEAAILELEEDHPGVGEKARALLAQKAATELWIETGEKAEAKPKTGTAPPKQSSAKPAMKRPVGAAPTPASAPKPKSAPKSEPEKKVTIFDRGPTIKWPKEWPEPPLPPPNASAYERLLYPPGLLGHAVQFVMDTAGLPDRKLALAVALSAFAKGIDRKVIGPSGNSTILFTLVIAETGAGKQHGFDCIRVLLRAMGIEHCYAAGGLASVQSIEEIIEGIKERTEPNPNALVVIDEVGGWLARILSKGQSGNVNEIPSHLQTLWGLSVESTWMGTKKLGKEMQSWYSVAFAIIGFSTEKMFFKALKDKLLGSGFVNRMLLFNVGRGAPERVDPKYGWNECPRWLVKAMRRVTSLDAAPFHGPMKLTIPAKDGSVVVLKDFHRVEWGPGVKEACRAYEKEIRAMPSVDDRELWIRTHDIALRLATVVAVYRCSGVVEVEDWEWAVALAKHSTEQLKRGVSKHMLEELEDADLADQIRDYFRDRESSMIPIGKVAKQFERKGNVKKVNDVIWHVVRTGDIIQLSDEEVVQRIGVRAGRPTIYFTWNGKRNRHVED
jgi:hypothetical protein